MAVGPRSAPEGFTTLARPPMSLLTVPGVLVGPGSPRATGRWQAGVGIQPDDCDVPLEWDGAGSDADFPYWWECPGDEGDTPQNTFHTIAAEDDGYKNIGAGEAVQTFDPILLWAGNVCRAGAPELETEAASRATRKLEALTPTAIEHELWTGQIADLAGFGNPAFEDAALATLVQGGAPLGFVSALGEIEQAIADVMPLTSPVIIHAQPRVVTAWHSRGLVNPVPAGTHLVTAAGTIVVPERGATGDGPGGAPAANYAYSYVYASSMVSVWLSAPQTRTSSDFGTEQGASGLVAQPMVAAIIQGGSSAPARAINNLEVRAERDFVTAWNPCGLLACRVALCDEYCIGGS